MLFLVVLVFSSTLFADQLGSKPLLPGLSGISAIFFGFLALILITTRLARLRAMDQFDRGTPGIYSLQAIYARTQQTMRGLAAGGHFALFFCTSWPMLTREILGERLGGLDELAMLVPFMVLFSSGYLMIYPIDRILREEMTGDLLYLFEPVQPIWTRGQYLSFQMRFNVFLVGLPLILIISAKDLLDVYRSQITYFGVFVLRKMDLDIRLAELTSEAALGVVAIIVLLFSPFLVRAVWYCRPLPVGQLRDELQTLARQIGLRYRDILLWPTYGVIANAAVVGMVGPVRYIMLSDGLIESLTDGQIEAVFGHEIGHVKHHHLPLQLGFAFASMGVMTLAGWHLQLHWQIESWIYEVSLFSSVFLVWFVLFGRLSRLCEGQADLFAAESLSSRYDDLPAGCGQHECLRHSPAAEPLSSPANRPICLAAAELVCSALDRAAALNAIPRTARSWRHGSISSRCQAILRFTADGSALSAFKLKTSWVRLVVLASALFAVSWGMLTVLESGATR